MKSNIFKKAHKLTKEIIRKGDSYKATFRLCLTFVYSQIKKGVNKMVELKGTEKQIKWAEDIRKELNSTIKFIEESVIQNKSKKGKSYEEAITKIEEVKNVINNKNESTYFIENFKELIKMNNKERLYFLHESFIRNSSLEDIKKLSVYVSLAERENR